MQWQQEEAQEEAAGEHVEVQGAEMDQEEAGVIGERKGNRQNAERDER